MKKAIAAMTATALGLVISMTPCTAFAQGRRDNHWQGGAQNRQWDAANTYQSGGQHRERRLSRNDEIYRGHDGRNYCRRSDGTTGLVIGAIGGSLLGKAIGGDTLSTLLGAGGGAVLGRSIDRGQVRCR
jgi:outer membrane lipoprotein SlyB